ncbi:helix-turn-helix domain-containing protein [Micromonospora sp. CPCC 206061]|uniref:helix-turn-helix domain-containing protein n=1 Tax=Micromonospora sp. CPCC 206061 TaxID=3122410 RepID=UPI002FF42B19
MSDNELGTYLRERREALTPSAVGLPAGSRRRTPGLRRAELATLAGISVEYLTRLEQGRDRHPSSQVLGALADALHLTTSERVRMRVLAKAADGAFPCHEVQPPAVTVRPTVRALLDRLEPTPAYVVNRLGDVLAFTTGYERLAGPLGLLDEDPPNLIRFAFTDERARSTYPEWELVADARAAALKAEFGPADPHVRELIDELTVTAGAAFSDRYRRVTGGEPRSGVERLHHPTAGELRLAYESLALPDADQQQLVTYLPADDATAAALGRLAGRRSGALRVA